MDLRGIKSIGTQTVTEQDEYNLLNKQRGNQGTWGKPQEK